MNWKSVFTIVMIFIFCFLAAQDDYEVWKQKQQEQLKEYKSAQDKAFVEFLEKNWEPFEVLKGEKEDTKPKPVEPPVAEPEMKTELPKENIVQEIVVPVFQEEEQIEKNSMIAVDKSAPQIEITFWGLPLTYNYVSDLAVELDPLDQKTVANFWYVISNSDFENLLSQAKESRDKMNLNDWGYCLLLNELGKKISKEDKNLTRLFVWFMLTKTGFETKIGYNENSVYLLLPTANKIFGVSFVEIDGKRFYAVSFDEKEKIDFAINTYEGNYPKADDLIDLGIDKSPNLGSSIVEKELKFKYDGQEYTIPVRYDQKAAEFFRDYPQTNLDVYFNAPLSPEATQSLTSGLKPILEGKSEAEAANIILRFVQTAFKYKTDGDQFGREKSFFSDETLFYPYCDCEDRSIIFSFLIRQILDREVVGLDYPGHIATGVNFVSSIQGDNIVVDNKVFTICDPTYINADLGMAMPQFKDVIPEVIVLSKKE
jgi:hypothetical protein